MDDIMHFCEENDLAVSINFYKPDLNWQFLFSNVNYKPKVVLIEIPKEDISFDLMWQQKLLEKVRKGFNLK